jgi:hypothetical protein
MYKYALGAGAKAGKRFLGVLNKMLNVDEQRVMFSRYITYLYISLGVKL